MEQARLTEETSDIYRDYVRSIPTGKFTSSASLQTADGPSGPRFGSMLACWWLGVNLLVKGENVLIIV
jgi:hypothetical protein